MLLSSSDARNMMLIAGEKKSTMSKKGNALEENMIIIAIFSASLLRLMLLTPYEMYSEITLLYFLKGSGIIPIGISDSIRAV